MTWRRLVVAVVLVTPAIVDPPAGRAFPVQALVLAGLVLPLLSRRRPVAMASIVLAAAWAGLIIGAWADQLPMAHLSMDAMLYLLVVGGRRRTALVAGPATVAFFAVWSLGVAPGPDAGWSVLTHLLLLASVWLLAEWVRARRSYLESVERRAELADSERRALARAAAAEERTRIARELHDVLAHSVSVMVVNAEGAQLMRDRDPAVVDRTLQFVSTTGREALAELRRLLTVLDEPGEVDDGGPSPQPALADLPALTAGVDRATLRITGSYAGVPVGAAMQVYRIVQEALTNVIKHAGDGASASVTVDLGQSGPRRLVRIEVRDDGNSQSSGRPFPGRSVAGLPSSGRGIAGMRERVAMFGGTLAAGPRSGGGFRVLATLPIGAGPSRRQPVTAAPQAVGDTMSGWPSSHRRGF
ncbi:ATP-binding protein [Actinoplanes bogorensis]|uniref:histidine kinase n=1 Tax=Paractinoplanes bogorensis TaxID=1610840 RepID=A0ABS5YX74_9ACTN|nr:histidine kinase [Actinoplanes bogorensis]MBU2667988.1 ATP-binding protein [Actinoplanes bogorensis]